MSQSQGQPEQERGQERFEGFSPQVRGVLQDLDRKLQPSPSAQRIWDRLTEEQREQLGGDIVTAYERSPHAAMMWAELYQVSQFRAYLEAGRELGFVSEADFSWLMQEIGEKATPLVDANLPHFNAELGELSLDGEIVGSFRVLQLPSIPCRILTAFEAAGWRSVIDDPLGGDAKDLQDGVGYLNQRVAGVRFRTQRSGEAISWERC